MIDDAIALSEIQRGMLTREGADGELVIWT